MKSLLIFPLLSACLLLSGCAAPSAHNSFKANKPSNGIIIDNHTSYTLFVLQKSNLLDTEKGARLKVLGPIGPKNVLFIPACTTNALEKMAFDIEAMKRGQLGCFGYMYQTNGCAHMELIVGTNLPAQNVTIRTRGLH